MAQDFRTEMEKKLRNRNNPKNPEPKQPEPESSKEPTPTQAETEPPKRGRGRPASPKNQKRTKQIAIFVTPELYARVKETAFKNYESLNGYINRMLEETSVPLEEVSEKVKLDAGIE